MLNNYIEKVRAFLRGRGLRYDEIRAQSHCRFKMGFSGLKGAYANLRVILSLDENIIQVIIHLPTEVDAQNSVRVMELVTRINYNLKFGKFEFNIDEGEVKFQMGQSVASLNVSDASRILETILYQSIYLADHMSRGIELAAHGTVSPKQIVERLLN